MDMATDRFSSAEDKLERAMLHIESLQADCSSDFLGSLVGHEVRARAEHTFDVVVTQVEPLPKSIALSTGDAVACLRAALDHLAWQVHEFTKSGYPDHRVFFPIAADRAVLTKKLNEGKRWLSTDAIRLIEESEPFEGGVGNDLWLLNELCNRDKHRRLLAAVFTQPLMDLGGLMTANLHRQVQDPDSPLYDPEWGEMPELSWFVASTKADVPVNAGDVIFTYSDEVSPTPSFPGLRLQYRACFQEPSIQGHPVGLTLNRLVDSVRRVCELFRNEHP